MKTTIPFIIVQVFGALVPAAVFFLGAGTIDLTFWVFVGLLAANILVQTVLNVRFPALFQERLQARPEILRWDKLISLLTAVLLVASYGWGGWVHRLSLAAIADPVTWQGVGAGVYLVAMGLGAWAMASNPFYSTFVRVQTERDHQVAQKGPYRWVRHPGYLAIFLQYLTLPLILGSYLLVPFTLLLAGLLFVRAAKEDALLNRDLEGYDSYSQKVGYKMIPILF